MQSLKQLNLNKLVINLVGDSGDGIQLIGLQLTEAAIAQDINVNTLPSFPAEIRAPIGTLAGISGYQLQLSEQLELTAGDKVNVLIAMNPAALKIGLSTMDETGLIIINQDSFNNVALAQAGYEHNPLETGELSHFQCIPIPMSTLTRNAIQEFALATSQVNKCKNMFALGVLSWLFSLDLNFLQTWIEQKFQHNLEILSANIQSLKTGYHFADISEVFYEKFIVRSRVDKQINTCQISGNEAFALACLAIATKSERSLLLAGYPITPASSLLHYVSQFSNALLQVFQAEDEIAALGAVLGAAYGGSVGIAVTSGPGFDLKTEGLGLAVMAELPLVVIDVQRAGPSTGMPTKPEQSDLLAAIYGRHGECPIPVLAPSSPGDCFTLLIEAYRMALKYMTPIIILSDAHLANATQCWEIPNLDDIEKLTFSFATESIGYHPYLRDSNTLARSWAIPGMKGFEHRIGGLEKESSTGNVSYDANNHQEMTILRQRKFEKIGKENIGFEWLGKDSDDIIVLSWGSTYGSIYSAVTRLRNEKWNVSHLHLRLLNPLPNNLQEKLERKKVIIAELNTGQLTKLIREKYLINTFSYNKINGQQFSINEIYSFIKNTFNQVTNNDTY